MKIFYTIIFILFFHINAIAQLNNGGQAASFGIDADTKSGYSKYGPVTGQVTTDDWFSSILSGYTVIDTSNSFKYLSLLQAGNNYSFSKRMSVPLYSKIGNKLWLDAAYGRDYNATNTPIDSTAFTTASKNGDNPVNWAGGSTSFPNKNDLVDVFAHMRRDGLTAFDSLWLFTGVSTVGTSGSRYFDIELYKNSFFYNAATGKFSTGGPDAGHTQWIFGATGNVLQTGDMIIAVSFTPGAAPVVDVRLWVSQSTYTNIIPRYFRFGANFDGATSAFGYASILSNTGTTAFGSGISNFSGSAGQDTTFSTPWGTSGSNQWQANYESLQFVEIGLNLTRIGIDPSLYTAAGLNPCGSLFSSIFFKSRSSNSFTSNMQDFVVPLTFLTFPVMDYKITPDTLRCNRSSGSLSITNNSTAGNYTWSTNTGNITGTSNFGSLATINKPGTYYISASPAPGCPVTRRDTVVVPIDTFPPVAIINYSLTQDQQHLQLLGGDLAASNYQTPFGGSKGLLWSWTGPAGFTSTIQNPVDNHIAGTYQLTVTEIRNGCIASVTKTIVINVLPTEAISLSGKLKEGAAQLFWKINPNIEFSSFEIQRTNRPDFSITQNSSNEYNRNNNETFTFYDKRNLDDINYYRIKGFTSNGVVYYSQIIAIRNTGTYSKNTISIFKKPGINSITLYANISNPKNMVLTLYTTSGALIYKREILVQSGENNISLELDSFRNLPLIAVAFAGTEEKYIKKFVY